MECRHYDENWNRREVLSDASQHTYWCRRDPSATFFPFEHITVGAWAVGMDHPHHLWAIHGGIRSFFIMCHGVFDLFLAKGDPSSCHDSIVVVAVMHELRYLPTPSSGVCFFFLASLACLSPPGFPDFFVVLLRIRGFQRSEFVNSCQQQPVFLTCSFMSLSSPMYCTLSLTVCKCTPCQQSKPHQCNRFFFSRGHDPYTHACKAFID